MINYFDPQTRYLIDYANLKQGLVKHQSDFLDRKKLNQFLKYKYLGCPLVLPMGIKYFDYKHTKNIFTISKNEARKYIFNCKSNNYAGMKIFFKYGNTFCTGAILKKKYIKMIENRYISILLGFKFNEISKGIEEINYKYKKILTFNDKLICLIINKR